MRSPREDQAAGEAEKPSCTPSRMSACCAIVRVHNLPDVRERYVAFGMEAVSSTPAGFGKIIQADKAKLS